MTLSGIERHTKVTTQHLELIKQNLLKYKLKYFIRQIQHYKANSMDSPVPLIVIKKKEATKTVPRIIKMLNIYPLRSFPFGTVTPRMNTLSSKHVPNTLNYPVLLWSVLGKVHIISLLLQIP